MTTPGYKPGLEDVIAGQTALCEVEQTGLRYRGYDIADLAEHATFDEVAHLLLHGALPNRGQLAEFRTRVQAAMTLPEPVRRVMAELPVETNPMDVLRTVVSMLGHHDPDVNDNSHAANLRKAERLLGQMAAAVGGWGQRISGHGSVRIDPQASHGGNLLALILGKSPDPLFSRVLDGTLILYAEHEFNASTFTARVIASTLADMHGAIAGAIAALKGPLHGGANEAAMRMFQEIGSVENVEPWFRRALGEKRKIMGFGHRVYKHGDHRASILREWSIQLTAKTGQKKWIDIADKLQALMLKEKNIHPNTDYPAAHAYFQMGIPVPLYTPIFVASRVSGWCAHVIEQHDDNRLFRPRSEYTGPGLRKVSPIDQR
ncbi:MAG: citrate synthase [Phycisphaerae bacterium]|nr:citrate synthase [Phycisphaerae bacterium]